MAKAKETTPKKGRSPEKAKATASQAEPLRRSPRKAVQTAKSLGLDVVAATSRVAKKAATMKTSTASKAQATTKATTPQSTSEKRPTEESAVLSADKGIATPSPKRGRPRKDPVADRAAAKAPKNGRVTKSSGGRKKESDEKTVVPAPTTDKDWTDSPKKRGPNKRRAEIPTSNSSPLVKLFEKQTQEYYGNERARQASLGGIRKSTERPSPARESASRRRSKSPVRRRSESPNKNPSKSVNKTSTREPSAQSAASAGRKRSRSPTKKAARAKRASRSPSRENPSRKDPSRKDPSRKDPSRKDPSRKDPSRKEPNVGPRARSGSPAKTTRGKSPSKPEVRAASRSPSVGALPRPLRVEKTRRSKSPSKDPALSPTRSRRDSPSKIPADTAHIRDSDRGSKSPIRSPVKEAKPKSRAPAQQAEGPRDEMFIDRFVKKDEYGKALRKIEAQGYRCTKSGRPIEDSNAAVNRNDKILAQNRGVQRAELEMGLHTIVDNKDHGAKKKSSGESTNQSAKSRQSRSGSRAPPVREETSESINERRRQELEVLLELNKALPYLSKSPRRPQKGVSSRRSSVSPRRTSVSPARQNAPRTRKSTSPLRKSAASIRKSPSPTRKSASPRKDTNRTQPPPPLRLGVVNEADRGLSSRKPSAPNRGTIRSVTNPEFIRGTNKKNPFFETMPAPEIWHRQMPPYFPFGETPFIQREMSRQINADLARGQEEAAETGTFFGRVTSAIKSGVHSVGQTLWREPPVQERPPAWELPQVAESEVREVLKDIKAKRWSPNKTTIAQKRKASAPIIGSPSKRVRRLSDEYRMSGAL